MHVVAALRCLHFTLALFQAGGLVHYRRNCSGIVARDASLLLLGWLVCNFEGESDAWWEEGIETYTLDLEYGGSTFGEDSSSRGSIHIVQIFNSLATPASTAYKKHLLKTSVSSL